ncbi:hypothetical protein CHCC20375_3948 [Bacillus licheniformis]|nr:hypothetical protein CHCC20375_3948 [Bacillus licheniformis]
MISKINNTTIKAKLLEYDISSPPKSGITEYEGFMTFERGINLKKWKMVNEATF